LYFLDRQRQEQEGQLKSLIWRGTFASSWHALGSFHLVDQLMVSNPFGKPGNKKLEKFLKVKGYLRAWSYRHLDESTLETKDEFETSTNLLIEWLGSKMVDHDCCSPSISRNMVEWLIKKILPFMVKCLLYRHLLILRRVLL
jgi:hypothetical protein